MPQKQTAQILREPAWPFAVPDESSLVVTRRIAVVVAVAAFTTVVHCLQSPGEWTLDTALDNEVGCAGCMS